MKKSAVIMEEYIREIRKQGDTVGTVTCVIQNVPIGLGEFFDKHAELGKAMLSINAVKGFEYSGFCGAQMKGSEHNDLHNGWNYKTNLSGGIQGNQQWYGHFFPCCF
jgi:chorismate synthase